MKSKNVNKALWVSLFREIGLDDASMTKWHQRFEKMNPEGHLEFLQWLNIPDDEIAEIREQ